MNARAPNILWLFPDEWRYDAVGYVGNPVVRTPHLDSLARRGTVFTGAHCEAPLCQPSRASLLTVSYPRDHRRFGNGPSDRVAPFPAPDADNFLHRLKDVGYRTAEAGKMHFYDEVHTEDELRAYGLDDVSEEYDKVVQRTEFVEAVVSLDTPYTAYLEERGLLKAWRDHQDEQTDVLFARRPGLPAAIPEALEPEHSMDAFIGRAACRMLREQATDGRPFFLWAGFVGPHVPFDGPPPYADLYDPATIPMGPMGLEPFPDNRYGAYLNYLADTFQVRQRSEPDYRVMAKHYYASITLIDEAIGGILETLDELGMAESTWIVLSSDHGELLGDHGMLTKGTFTRGSVQVPMLVVPPVGQAPVANRIDGLVQGLDVPATILALAGADRTGFHGHDLSASDASWTRPAAISQIGDFTMLYDGRHKLVVTTDTVEPQQLHDLVADPDERVDVCGRPQYAEVQKRLLDTWVHPFLAAEVS